MHFSLSFASLISLYSCQAAFLLNIDPLQQIVLHQAQHFLTTSTTMQFLESPPRASHNPPQSLSRQPYQTILIRSSRPTSSRDILPFPLALTKSSLTSKSQLTGFMLTSKNASISPSPPLNRQITMLIDATTFNSLATPLHPSPPSHNSQTSSTPSPTPPAS